MEICSSDLWSLSIVKCLPKTYMSRNALHWRYRQVVSSYCLHSVSALDTKVTGPSSWMSAAPSPLLDALTWIVTGFFVLKYLSVVSLHTNDLSLSNATWYVSRYRCFPPPVDLSVPGVSLRPPALVMLSCDTVKVHGTGDVVCKQWLLGSWHKPRHWTSSRCHMSHYDVAWHHLPAPLNTLPSLCSRSLTISHLAAWIP